MDRIETNEAFDIIGWEMRTHNDDGVEPFIRHWYRFQTQGGHTAINERLNDNVYAVYTNFMPGVSVENIGTYSMILGCQVAAGTRPPEGMTAVHVPSVRRAVFPVQTARPDLVGECWAGIWADRTLPRSFSCDYERYQTNGNIDIFIGLR